MMRKKVGFVISIVLLIFAVFTGCQRALALPSQKGEIKILLALNDTDAFRKTLVEAAQTAAREKGVILDVKNAKGSIEAQSDYIKSAKSDGYNVIICSPVSLDTVVALKASAGNLPIVFINSCPDDKYLEADHFIYVGSSEETAGQYQAEYVLDTLSDKETLNVVLLKGPKEHSATLGRTEGVKKAFKNSGKTIHYVFEDNANWDTSLAEKMFKIFLRTGVKPDCVICNNDAMALGVISACQKAQIDLSSLLVLGVDATTEGRQAIQAGDMAFTVYQSAKGQGTAAIEAAIHFAKGESVRKMDGITADGKYIWIPFEKVDKSNITKYN